MNRVISLGVIAITASVLPLMAVADHEEGGHGKRMAKMMSHLDTDESGTISFSEFRVPEAPDMRMDLNGDGNIARDEVSEAITQHSERALARFDETDLDSDGVVTSDERRQAAFNRVDSNGDGQLTKSEMGKARKKLGKKMRRHGGKGSGKKHRQRERN